MVLSGWRWVFGLVLWGVVVFPLKARDLVVDGSGHALWKGRTYRCATGANGVVPGGQRREGTSTTPAGVFRILYVLWRPDRGSLPAMKLEKKAITPDSAWCNQKNSPLYNTLVSRSSGVACTPLWLDDLDWFDVVAVLDYNMPGGTLGEQPLQKPVTGPGYGIFMHIRKPAYAPSRGCIGLSREDLVAILREFDPDHDRVVVRLPGHHKG